MKTALLAEDNDELRVSTRDVLADLGYAVTAAADADEALAAAHGAVPEGGFDLLVTDIEMPGMSGLELVERLLVRVPELAVLLISSRGGEPEVRRRLAAGDVAFLAKPFAPVELAEKVSVAFERVDARRGDATTRASSAPSRPDRAGTTAVRRSAASASRALLFSGLALILVTAIWHGLEPGPPPLPPAPAPGGPSRGTIVDVVRPLGPLAEPPRELVWRPVDGAVSYALSVRSLDGSALWQGEASRPPAILPAEVLGALHRAITYYWSVEALDAAGKRIGRSELAPFAVDGSPETQQDAPPEP